MSKAAFLAAFIMAAPGAAFAQDWVVPGPAAPAVVAPGPIVGGVPAAGPRVFEYVEEQPAPAYDWYVENPPPVYGQRVVIGEAVPPGVVFYPAPRRYGVTHYRYAIVGQEPVLVDPYTRRVVEVLD